MSEGLSDRIPGDAKTISDGLLREALVAVEPDPALLAHRQQINDRDDDLSNHINLIFQAKRMYCKRMNIGYTGYIHRGKFSVIFGNMDLI